MPDRAWSMLLVTWFVVASAGLGCGDCGGGPEREPAKSSKKAGQAERNDPTDDKKESSERQVPEDETPELVKSDALPEAPERIVALAPNVTEILYALDLGDQIVAVSQHSDHPEAAREKPSVGNFQNPDFESLIAHDPDIVVGTTSGGDESVATRLAEADIPYYFVRMSTIEETLAGVRRIGEAVGRGAEAAALASKMQQEMADTAATYDSRESPSVLMVFGREPLVAAGPGTFGHQLIVRAGGTNVLGGAATKYPRVDIEKVLQLDPDVILDAAGMGVDAGAPSFWKQFDSVGAVQENRVKYLEETAVLRPGPRLPKGLSLIAESIHE